MGDNNLLRGSADNPEDANFGSRFLKIGPCPDGGAWHHRGRQGAWTSSWFLVRERLSQKLLRELSRSAMVARAARLPARGHWQSKSQRQQLRRRHQTVLRRRRRSTNRAISTGSSVTNQGGRRLASPLRWKRACWRGHPPGRGRRRGHRCCRGLPKIRAPLRLGTSLPRRRGTGHSRRRSRRNGL